MVVCIPYLPRAAFEAFHQRFQRWAVLVVHRRAGKTVAAINELIKGAVKCQKQSPRFAYVAPTYAQAKDVAWSYLKRFTECFPGRVVSEAELHVTLPGDRRIRLYGSDNYDRMRGIYLDGCVVDEPADMDPAAWYDVIRPALSDRQGWCVWIGTPKGRDAFYRLWSEAASSPEWYTMRLPASESGILPAEELASAKLGMRANPGAFEREYECSFETPVAGSLYGDVITQARAAGRVLNFEYKRTSPIFSSWDIGWSDSTTIWLWQIVGQDIHWIWFTSQTRKTAAEMVTLLDATGIPVTAHFLPHDAFASKPGEGKSYQNLLAAAGLINMVKVPQCRSIGPGIDSLRALLMTSWFRLDQCKLGLEALEAYHTKEVKEGAVVSKEPVHDWCLARDTEILTALGWRKVQEIAVHNEVLTPCGNRRVIRSGIVRYTNKWVTIKGIRCTPEHRFFTSRGLVQAGELSLQETFLTQGSWATLILACLSAIFRLGCKGAITLATQGTEGATAGRYYCIGWFMKLFMARFRKGTKSITSTITRSITTPKTLLHFPVLCTEASTNQSRDISVYAACAERLLAATKSSVQDAARRAGGSIMQEWSENVEPAYNLTVACDECYFVRGGDGKAYLVSNSSHAADAARYAAEALELGLIRSFAARRIVNPRMPDGSVVDLGTVIEKRRMQRSGLATSGLNWE